MGSKKATSSNAPVDILPRLERLGLDHHEQLIFLKDAFSGCGLTQASKREFHLTNGRTQPVVIKFNTNQRLKSVMMPSGDQKQFDDAEGKLIKHEAIEVANTTALCSRPIANGFACVEDWIQIRDPGVEIDDLTLLARSGAPGELVNRPFPLHIEVKFRQAALPLVNAYRRQKAVREGMWLLNAFLEIPIHQDKSPHAFVWLDGKVALADCTSPTLENFSPTQFSDVSSLTELTPVNHVTYYSQLGISNGFRVPDLSLLHGRYLELCAKDRTRFLRACASLFDSSNPHVDESFSIVASVSAIEALLEVKVGGGYEETDSISKTFKAFLTEHIGADTAAIPVLKELYASRSKIAHGSYHPEVDAPLFSLSMVDRLGTRLAAFLAARRGLVNWLLSRAAC